MIQAEWKRIINEIEKAIKNATASNEENYERSIKENNALIAVPLNSLADHLERYTIQQHTNDERRSRREIATIIGLGATGLFTLITAIIFYFQLNQMRIAIRHTDEAARIQHSDTLVALQKAEDANTNAKATADRQAKDATNALTLSRQAAEAANDSAKIARETLEISQGAVISVNDWTFEGADAATTFTISFKIFNKGRTDANLLDLVYKYHVANSLPDIPDYEGGNKIGPVIISPDTSITAIPKPYGITQPQYDAITRGETTLYIYGRITFSNVFSQVFDYGFAQKVTVSKDAQGKSTFKTFFPETAGYNYIHPKNKEK